MEKLRHSHGSIPGNPLLAEPLYLTKYIERMGTGTGDMIELCRAAGLPKPEFALTDGFVTTIRRKTNGAFLAVGGQVTAQVVGQVGSQEVQIGSSRDQVTILRKCLEECSLRDLMTVAGRSNRTKFKDQVLQWAAAHPHPGPRLRNTVELRRWLAEMEQKRVQNTSPAATKSP